MVSHTRHTAFYSYNVHRQPDLGAHQVFALKYIEKRTHKERNPYTHGEHRQILIKQLTSNNIYFGIHLVNQLISN